LSEIVNQLKPIAYLVKYRCLIAK